MEVAGPVFAKFADLLVLRTIDIYGSPSERVVEQLLQKAELLGTATVAIHERQAGFARFASPRVPYQGGGLYRSPRVSTAPVVFRTSCFSFFSARFSLIPFAAFFLTFLAPLSFACGIAGSSVSRR